MSSQSFPRHRQEIEGKVSLASSSEGQQHPRLIQAMQGREVDEAIMAERERDILKINQDLVLVKEMFRFIFIHLSSDEVMIRFLIILYYLEIWRS